MDILPSKTKLKQLARYFVIGGVVFAIGAVWNFPYDRLRGTLSEMIRKNTGYRVEMDDLSLALPSGLAAEKVRIQGRTPNGIQIDKEFDSVEINVSTFLLVLYPIMKTISASFEIEQKPNLWEGSVKTNTKSKEMNLRVETEGFRLDETIDLGDVNPMLAGSNLRVTGTVDLKTRLSGNETAISSGNFTKAEGTLAFLAKNLVIEAPQLKSLRFNEVDLKAGLEKGKLDITSLRLKGKEISGTANGSIRVEPYFLRSRIALDAKLKIAEEASELRTLISLGEMTMGFKMDPQGNLPLKISGPLTPASRLTIQ